jgi:formate hydrogenlyase transcriptional activator
MSNLVHRQSISIAPRPEHAVNYALVAKGTEEMLSDFELVCERSVAGIYIVQGGRIKYANPAMAELLGCDLEGILGKSPFEFVHPDDRSEVQEQMRRRLDGEAETSRFEARCIQPDGSCVHVEVLGSRLDFGGQMALVGTMIDITARKQVEMALEDRIRFERLLADLTAAFVNLPVEEIDQQIDCSLKSLVNFLGIDRSTFIEFGEDERHVLVTHAVAAGGCEPFPLGPFPTERLPWFIGQIRSGKYVFLRDASEDLPLEAMVERQFCRAQGIKSNVSLPLKAGGELLGGITFGFIRNRCEWPIEIVSRLQMIGEVFANALLRRRTDEKLHAALIENQRLRQQLEQENLYLREQSVLRHCHGHIIGRSDAIISVLREAECVAATDTPVLLLGETGTGKELVAQAIHELSGRKSRPMVIVNCASLPMTLVESELFGREAGAYTGAASAQVGRFQVADGSTLFLDEIGELPLELQAKLLRVLQDGRFERLGSSKTISVDVRIIAATNRDLEQCVRENRFRPDLYHRLNVFPIRIPPLRERCDDIPPLVWAFVEKFSRRMGKKTTKIPRKTMHQLQRYSWPGNVRELSNVLERAMILSNSDTLTVDFPAMMQTAAAHITLKASEHDQILLVMQETGWRIRGAGGAAELLDIKPTTLEARMAKLGIKRPNSASELGRSGNGDSG